LALRGGDRGAVAPRDIAGAAQPVGLQEAVRAAGALPEAGGVGGARVAVPQQAERAPGEVVVRQQAGAVCLAPVGGAGIASC
jgi:hypothetical protein